MKYLSLIPSDGGGASSSDPFGKIKPPPGLESFAQPESALSRLLTVGIRAFFMVAGITALYYLMWGAFDWITSGGEKEKLSTARNRMTNAVIGLLILIAILGIGWILENVVFGRQICFGLTCGFSIPRIGM